ncbi:MAG: hypothetical protein QGG42_00815 [Phycisphaerae bacterium]|jgi:hypothetical protein|nr:hypothetical protein [Phycisphaerae bacterium]
MKNVNTIAAGLRIVAPVIRPRRTFGDQSGAVPNGDGRFLPEDHMVGKCLWRANVAKRPRTRQTDNH